MGEGSENLRRTNRVSANAGARAGDDSFLMRSAVFFLRSDIATSNPASHSVTLSLQNHRNGVSVLCFPLLDISLRVDVFARARLR